MVLAPAPVLAWIAAGFLMIALWAATAMPPRLWPRLVRSGWAVLVVGVGVGCAAEVAGQIVQLGWDVLGQPTLWTSYYLLRPFAADAVCDPETMTLGTAQFRVAVMPACSGYEGMGLITVYLAGYLWLFRRELRFPRALILWPLGLAAVWLLNAVRLAVLVLIGDRVSPELALGGFHSQAGWLGFNAVALGLVFLAHRSRRLTAKAEPVGPASGSSTAAYLAPLLVAVAAQMLTTAFVTDPTLLYPVRVTATVAALWYFWPRYESLRAGRSWRSAALALVTGIVVYLLWATLGRPTSSGDSPDPRGELVGLEPWAVALWFGIKVVGFVVVTPIAEELAFRGYLMRRLIAADFERVPVGRFTWLSFLISSALFGLLHGHWVAGTLAGMAYAALACRTGRLRDAVLAHAATNGLLAATAQFTGDMRWWA
jgi:exosortase E/protease (VPEID-CTERM system)